MSLSKVIPYFRDKMTLLGYTEWEDEFNIENIPRSQLDSTYHIEIGLITGSEASHTCFDFDFPVTITIHSCITNASGSSKAAEEMLEVSDNILCSLLLLEDRYSQEGFLKVTPTSVDFEPISSSNDNVIKVRLEFGVFLKKEYRLT